MKKPDLLPDHLQFISDVNSEESLFQKLVSQIALFVEFFECACDDETWALTHKTFMRKSVEWFDQEFFQERLSRLFASRIVSSLQKHFLELSCFVPNDLTIVVKDGSFSINRFMVSVCSEKLRHQIVLKEDQIHLNTVSKDHFHLFKEYIEYGRVNDLWKYDQNQLLLLQQEAAIVDLIGFMDLCAHVLKRYFTKDNILDYLFLAQNELWMSLKNDCIDFINRNNMGVAFRKTDEGSLWMEWIHLDENSVSIFEKFKSYVTQLICGKVAFNPRLGELVAACPNLVRLDLSQSDFVDLQILPSDLKELDISMCLWLKDEELHQIVSICPHLRSLYLSSNIQLTYRAWSSLQKLKNLQVLDVSRCNQIEDESLLLIGKASPDLQELNLSSCSNISDYAFTEVAQSFSKLIGLDVSRTEIADRGLVEMAARSPGLIDLNVSRCESITENGIKEVLKLATDLQTLDIRHCPISKAFIEQIKKENSHLRVL